MSIIDNRTIQYLGGTRTDTGVALLTTTLSISPEKLNALMLLPSLQAKIDMAERERIKVELCTYDDDLSKVGSILSNFIQEQGMPEIAKHKIVKLKEISDILLILRTALMYNYSLNPVQLTPELLYDAPYFKVNGIFVCYFTPKFEETLNYANCKVMNNIFVYEYKKEIFYLETGYHRHMKSERLDRLSINLKTGKAVSDYMDIVDNQMVNYKFVFDRNQHRWIKDTRYTKVVRVEGFKQC